jgi:hypothetical protein
MAVTYTNQRTGQAIQVPDMSDDVNLRNQGFRPASGKAATKAATTPEPADYEANTVEELRTLADQRQVEVKRGDGEDGAPLKADYVKALKRQDRRDAQG